LSPRPRHLIAQHTFWPAVDPTPISVDLASKATASGAEAKVEKSLRYISGPAGSFCRRIKTWLWIPIDSGANGPTIYKGTTGYALKFYGAYRILGGSTGSTAAGADWCYL
jgi:hypothetical protein